MKTGLDDQGILSKLAENRCLIPALLPAGMSLEHLGLENLLEKIQKFRLKLLAITHKTKEEVKILHQENSEKVPSEMASSLTCSWHRCLVLWNQLAQKEVLKTETATEKRYYNSRTYSS